MIITVVNMSKSTDDADLHRVVRAINRQVREDFEPYWSLGAALRLEGKTGDSRPNKVALAEMRGDAVLYLWDDKDEVEDALGYHDRNARGLPFGFVFKTVSQAAGEAWTVTMSHEALELIADPLVNLLVAGPHPEEDRTVFHWYEMSDAVQAETYELDGIEVSNFVLPLYFTPDAEKGSRNDFLGRSHAGKTLPSFGINPGGYVGFFDPKVNKDVTYALSGDDRAKKRLAAKRAMSPGGRRSHRMATWPREQSLEFSARSMRPRGESPAAKSGDTYERID